MAIACTERLILRELTHEDAAFILVLLNSQGFIDNIGDKGVRSLADAKSYLTDGPMKSYAERGFGLYAIDLAENGFSIGLCGLIKRPSLAHVDIGYALLPQYWGKGYAFEAGCATLALAKRLNIHPVVAIVSEDNAASKVLLQKLGLVFECQMQLTAEDKPVDLFKLIENNFV